MLIAAIDPGLCAGVCLHDTTKRTFKAGILDDTWWPLLWPAHMAIIERPMIYPGKQQKARPKDIITLAIRAGEFGGTWKSKATGNLRYVEPYEWKKQLDKDKTKKRILAMLDTFEYPQLAHLLKLPKTQEHNAWDAVGLALWAAGRKMWS